MTVRIELPRATGVVAGVLFADGSAEVAALGKHARAFFTAAGATITDMDESDPLAGLRVGDKLLTDCTVAELRDLAQSEGIEVPSKATKPDILGLFLAAFMEGD